MEWPCFYRSDPDSCQRLEVRPNNPIAVALAIFVNDKMMKKIYI